MYVLLQSLHLTLPPCPSGDPGFGGALRVDAHREEQVGQCPGLDPVFMCSAVAQSLKGLPVASLVAMALHSWKLGELGLKHFNLYLPTNTSSGPDTLLY